MHSIVTRGMHTWEVSIFILHYTEISISAIWTILNWSFAIEMVITHLDDVDITPYVARDSSSVSETCHVIHHVHVLENNLGRFTSAVNSLLGDFVSSEVSAFNTSRVRALCSIGEDVSTDSAFCVSINRMGCIVLEPQGSTITAIVTLSNETSISTSCRDIVVHRYICTRVTGEIGANSE